MTNHVLDRKNISLTWKLSNGKWLTPLRVDRFGLTRHLKDLRKEKVEYRYKIMGMVYRSLYEDATSYPIERTSKEEQELCH